MPNFQDIMTFITQFATDYPITAWLARISAHLLISLIFIWGVLFIISQIKILWVEHLQPKRYTAEQKRRVLHRQRFADHLESELRRLNNLEEWRDYRYTELEAEVEAEGRYLGYRWGIPLLEQTRTGLRREKSLSKALEISRERLILVEGDPGAGKSVALRHVASIMAKKATHAKKVNTVIPIYINLKELEHQRNLPLKHRVKSGLSADLQSRLQLHLPQCSPFKSDFALNSIFVDNRLIAWQNQLPATSTEIERVSSIVNFLYQKRNNKQENGLVLLLQVLQDHVDPQDATYNHLTDLIHDLQQSGVTKTDSPPDSIDKHLIEAFVLKSLNRVNDRDIEEFLEREFAQGLRDGTWLFLFDSFDELPDVLSSTEADGTIQQYTQAISDFLHGMNQCRGVVASRQFRGPGQVGWQRFRILALSETRRELLIRNADLEPPIGEKLIGQLGASRPEIRSMASNPLFLGLLCEHMRNHNPFPQNAHDVFETYINHRLTRDEGRLQKRFGLTPQTVRTVAEQVSFCIGANVGIGLSPNRASLLEAMQKLGLEVTADFETGLDALEHIKLARAETATMPDQSKSFTFAHRRFQEYFATCIVLRNPDRVSPHQLLTDARWRETAVVLCQTQPLTTLAPLLAEAQAQIYEMVKFNLMAEDIERQIDNGIEWTKQDLLEIETAILENKSQKDIEYQCNRLEEWHERYTKQMQMKISILGFETEKLTELSQQIIKPIKENITPNQPQPKASIQLDLPTQEAKLIKQLSNRFAWPTNALHLLGLLQDGFGNRLQDLPENIRLGACILLEDATHKGSLVDKKWAMEVAGTIPQPVFRFLLIGSLISKSQWLKDIAYQQIARLEEITPNMAKALQKALIDMFASGQLKRDHQTTQIYLQRLKQAPQFLIMMRVLLSIPKFDTFVHITTILIIGITGLRTNFFISALTIFLLVFSASIYFPLLQRIFNTQTRLELWSILINMVSIFRFIIFYFIFILFDLEYTQILLLTLLPLLAFWHSTTIWAVKQRFIGYKSRFSIITLLLFIGGIFAGFGLMNILLVLVTMLFAIYFVLSLILSNKLLSILLLLFLCINIVFIFYEFSIAKKTPTLFSKILLFFITILYTCIFIYLFTVNYLYPFMQPVFNLSIYLFLYPIVITSIIRIIIYLFENWQQWQKLRLQKGINITETGFLKAISNYSHTYRNQFIGIIRNEDLLLITSKTVSVLISLIQAIDNDKILRDFYHWQYPNINALIESWVNLNFKAVFLQLWSYIRPAKTETSNLSELRKQLTFESPEFEQWYRDYVKDKPFGLADWHDAEFLDELCKLLEQVQAKQRVE